MALFESGCMSWAQSAAENGGRAASGMAGGEALWHSLLLPGWDRVLFSGCGYRVFAGPWRTDAPHDLPAG